MSEEQKAEGLGQKAEPYYVTPTGTPVYTFGLGRVGLAPEGPYLLVGVMPEARPVGEVSEDRRFKFVDCEHRLVFRFENTAGLDVLLEQLQAIRDKFECMFEIESVRNGILKDCGLGHLAEMTEARFVPAEEHAAVKAECERLRAQLEGSFKLGYETGAEGEAPR